MATLLDHRLTARSPAPPATVDAARNLHRAATDWLLVEGALSRWNTKPPTKEPPCDPGQ